jgi:hypothetical protein
LRPVAELSTFDLDKFRDLLAVAAQVVSGAQPRAAISTPGPISPRLAVDTRQIADKALVYYEFIDIGSGISSAIAL